MILRQNEKLFDDSLSVYPHHKVHIDIDADAKQVHVWLSTLKHELDHLVQLSILISQQASKWASPYLIIPKKDDSIHWLSELCQLNKVSKHKQYPLPIITDILHEHIGYSFFTKFDISMQYCTFELNEESQNLCTIITPFGKYKYTCLYVGIFS